MKKILKEKQDQGESGISIKKPENETYVLKLYVTGMTPSSTLAIKNLKEICDNHLKGIYNLEVIDLYKNPGLAIGEQIIAAPTLVKKLPLPFRRIIGNMSDTERVLVGLDLKMINSPGSKR